MALSRKVGTFTCATSTGNQAVTGLGFQPKMVLFYWIASTQGLSYADGMYLAVGAASSSTARWVMSISNSDALTDSNCSRSFHSDRCLFQVDASEATLCSADFVSMDADGFTLNWTVANSVVRDICYVALGGSDLSAFVGNFDLAAGTGNQSVTGFGFQPKAMLFGNSIAGVAEGTQVHASLMFGHAVSSTDRAVSEFFGTDASATMDEQRVDYTDRCIVRIDNTPTVVQSADFVSHDADGFTVNVTVAGAVRLGYVALGGTARFKGGTFSIPSTNDLISVTGVGFSPELLLTHSTGAPTLNTIEATYSKLNLGAGDKDGNVAATSGTAVVSSSSNTKRFLSLQHAHINGEGTATTFNTAGAAFLWSTNSDGFTLRSAGSSASNLVPVAYLAISGAVDTAEYTFPINTVNTGVRYYQEPVAAVPTTTAVVAPYRGYAAYPAAYSISGTVKEDAIGVARLIRAYRRDTGEFLGETTSAGDGSFTLSSSHALNKQVYLIAFDDSGGTAYNAQIFDLVVPV
jgi:hypothetical protein